MLCKFIRTFLKINIDYNNNNDKRARKSIYNLLAGEYDPDCLIIVL